VLESQRSILLVDDEASVLDLLQRLLAKHSYRVLPARNVYQAKACFQLHPGEIDLLLSDVCLPDGTGIELAEALQREQHSLQVLLMSGSAGSTVLPYFGLPLSDQHFINKPFHRDDLLRRIAELLHIPVNPDQTAPRTHLSSPRQTA